MTAEGRGRAGHARCTMGGLQGNTHGKALMMRVGVVPILVHGDLGLLLLVRVGL